LGVPQKDHPPYRMFWAHQHHGGQYAPGGGGSPVGWSAAWPGQAAARIQPAAVLRTE